MRFFTPSKGLIGVDITSTAVKLLELRSCSTSGQTKSGQQQRSPNERYQLDSHAVQPLRENAVVERRIRDINEVVTALKRAVEQANPATRKAAVAIPASATISKTLRFPAALSEDEIEERIAAESDRYIPFPFSDVAFDFQRLDVQGLAIKDGVSDAPDEDQQEVILVACRQQDVRQLTDIVERAELEPVAVDLTTLAMERALAGQYKRSVGEHGIADCVGLVNIGASMSALHVVRGGRVVYSRETLFGGRQLTETICEYYRMRVEEAEFAKIHGGLAHDYQAKVLAPFIATLVQQVRRLLQLYYAVGGQYDVQQIILAGGSSVIPGLALRIADESGIPVTIANPFQQVRINKRLNMEALSKDAPAMLTASGLAMRVG